MFYTKLLKSVVLVWAMNHISHIIYEVYSKIFTIYGTNIASMCIQVFMWSLTVTLSDGFVHPCRKWSHAGISLLHFSIKILQHSVRRERERGSYCNKSCQQNQPHVCVVNIIPLTQNLFILQFVYPCPPCTKQEHDHKECCLWIASKSDKVLCTHTRLFVWPPP